MRIALPPCPKCTGRLHVEYPTAQFAMLHVKPEAVCLQCGWRRGVLLRDVGVTDATPVPANVHSHHQQDRAA